MQDCNLCATPMESRLKLSRNKYGDVVVNPTAYRTIIGSLKYIVNTRQNLDFVVEVVSRYMEAPNKEHWASWEACFELSLLNVAASM